MANCISPNDFYSYLWNHCHYLGFQENTSLNIKTEVRGKSCVEILHHFVFLGLWKRPFQYNDATLETE